MTIQQFIDKYSIKIDIERIPFRLDSFDEQWDKTASHYMYELKDGGQSMRGYFSQGSAIKKRPTTEDILNSLLCDVNGIEDQTFENWCSDYGYDSDSIKVNDIYRACQKEARELLDVLGRDRYSELLECETL